MEHNKKTVFIALMFYGVGSGGFTKALYGKGCFLVSCRAIKPQKKENGLCKKIEMFDLSRV